MRQLDDAETEKMLTAVGVGVLSMVDDEGPYGIPVSFGYDDGEISFILQSDRAAESRKLAALSAEPRVCLTVVQQEHTPREVWRSVVVTGELVEPPLDSEEAAVDALADNATFAPGFNVFDAPDTSINKQLFRLAQTSREGREFGTGG